MPTTILASRYNTLKDAVNLVLSNSSIGNPTYGYGQGVTTNSVVGTRGLLSPSAASKVTAQDYEDLYIDLIRTRAHQVGAAAAISAFVVGDYNTNGATTDKIEESYVIGLESLASSIATDRFTVDPTNLRITAAPEASSSRTGTWTTTISHIFTMSFPTAQARRHYFNSGGEIRLSASVDYTGSQAKTVDWQTILNAMGTVSFKGTNTVNNAGIGSDTSIGSHDLSGSYQIVYTRSGGNVYARNRYNVYAMNYTTGDSTSAIRFKVEFIDGAPNNVDGFGIDEIVYGTFNSVVQTVAADGTVTINGTSHATALISDDPTGLTTRPLS